MGQVLHAYLGVATVIGQYSDLSFGPVSSEFPNLYVIASILPYFAFVHEGINFLV